MSFFMEIAKALLKFKCNHKRPRIGKEMMGKKNKGGGITLPDLKVFYTGYSHRRYIIWHVYGTGIKTDRPMGQNLEHRNKPKHMRSVFDEETTKNQ